MSGALLRFAWSQMRVCGLGAESQQTGPGGEPLAGTGAVRGLSFGRSGVGDAES